MNRKLFLGQSSLATLGVLVAPSILKAKKIVKPLITNNLHISYAISTWNVPQATKIAGEAMCTAYNDRYGLEVIGLRYMNVYGAGQDQHAVYSGVVPIVLNKIDRNEAPIVNGDGTQAYDFIYVEDVARSNIDAIKSDIKLGNYNIGTGVQTIVNHLYNMMLKLKNSTLYMLVSCIATALQLCLPVKHGMFHRQTKL